MFDPSNWPTLSSLSHETRKVQIFGLVPVSFWNCSPCPLSASYHVSCCPCPCVGFPCDGKVVCGMTDQELVGFSQSRAPLASRVWVVLPAVFHIYGFVIRFILVFVGKKQDTLVRFAFFLGPFLACWFIGVFSSFFSFFSPFFLTFGQLPAFPSWVLWLQFSNGSFLFPCNFGEMSVLFT